MKNTKLRGRVCICWSHQARSPPHLCGGVAYERRRRALTATPTHTANPRPSKAMAVGVVPELGVILPRAVRVTELDVILPVGAVPELGVIPPVGVATTAATSVAGSATKRLVRPSIILLRGYGNLKITWHWGLTRLKSCTPKAEISGQFHFVILETHLEPHPFLVALN